MGSSGPEEAIKGIVEDVKGKAKEIIGIVVNHEDLRKEGRAQQEKAEAQRNVAKKEAEATSARAAEKAATNVGGAEAVLQIHRRTKAVNFGADKGAGEDAFEQAAYLVDQVRGDDDGARVLGVVFEQRG